MKTFKTIGKFVAVMASFFVFVIAWSVAVAWTLEKVGDHWWTPILALAVGTFSFWLGSKFPIKPESQRIAELETEFRDWKEEVEEAWYKQTGRVL